MILLVQIICLCYTLYVLQEYATSGAYSRQHRLLPLLVGLIGVYNFYQVVLTLTGQTELFGRLKDMLLIQVLYALPAAGNLSHLFQNLLNRMYGGDRCNGNLRLSAPFPDHA